MITDISELKGLSANEDSIVSRPDKGNGVVIVDKDRYVSSMLSLISDQSKFEQINTDVKKYASKVEDKVNSFLCKLKSLNSLSADVYKKLLVSSSGPGILYGLPKVEKTDFFSKFKFRPIFAAYNTPSFGLAKYLVPVLAPLDHKSIHC